MRRDQYSLIANGPQKKNDRKVGSDFRLVTTVRKTKKAFMPRKSFES